MGCTIGSQRIHAYFDSSGRIISFEYPDRHYATRELTYVSTHDTKRFHVEEECYLLSSDWHAKWIDFVTKQTKKSPPAISNAILVTSDFERISSSSAPISSSAATVSSSLGATSIAGFERNESLGESGNMISPPSPQKRRGPHLRPDAKPKVHFRPVNKLVWEYLFKLYGGGPVITFKVPPGLDPDHYIDGSWVKRLKLSDIAIIIFPSEDPEPPRIQHVNNPLAANNNLSTANAHMITNMMLNEQSRAKFKQAKSMQSEINQSNSNTIATQFAKDLGKQKMEEAKKKQLEANMQFAGSISSIFKSGNKKKANEDAVKAAKKKAIQAEISVLIARNNLKKRFHQALQNKDMNEARLAAVRIIQYIWMANKAKFAARRLHRENMAKRIQSMFRIRLAYKKAQLLKKERQRLQEEGCAIMLQAAWRRKKSQQKVAELKAQRQRLLEEGAILRIQSRWRILLSRRKVEKIKIERFQRRQRIHATAHLIVGRFMIMFGTKIRLRKLIERRRNMFKIRVYGARDLENRCTNVAVIVHIEKGTILDPTIEIPTNRKNRVTLSMFKTQSAGSTTTPRWGEECLLVNATIQDKLVFTVVNQHASGKRTQPDEFLGQTAIYLHNHPQIFSGKLIPFNNLELGGYAIGMTDTKGGDVQLLNSNRPGGGFIDVSVKLVSRGMSQAGWVLKRAAHILGGHQYTPRYLVLVDGNLSYCDDEHFLDRPRGTIEREHVMLLEYGPDANSTTGEYILHIKSFEDVEWFFKFLPDEKMEVIQSWLRKLQYANPLVKLNGEGSHLLAERTEQMDMSRMSRISTADALIELKNTVKLAGRRASNLF